MGEWIGVLIAIVSSSLGGTAAAVTRYLVSDADAVTLAILRWGIGFACLLAGRVVAAGEMAAARATGSRSRRSASRSSDCSSFSIMSR